MSGQEPASEPRWRALPYGRALVDPSGSYIRIELGTRHESLPGMAELSTPRKCSRCRELTVFATPRGRPLHPGCTGWLDSVSPALYAEIIGRITAELRPTDIRDQ